MNIYNNLIAKKIDTFFVIHKEGNFKDYLEKNKINYKFLPIKKLAEKIHPKFQYS